MCNGSGVCTGGTARDCTGGNACLSCTCSNAGAGSCNCTNRGASAASALTATSSCLTANSGARLAVVLTLVDTGGAPLTGATVTFTATGGATFVEPAAVEVANPPGTYYRTLNAPAAVGTVTVSASVAACAATTAITQTQTITVPAEAPATGFGGAAFQGVRGCSPVAGHVRVKVIAEETGAPIVGANVMIGAAAGTPLVPTAAALYPTPTASGANTGVTNAQGVIEFLDFGATLRGPMTVTAGAANRAYVTLASWNGADQVIALPLRRPTVTTHAYSGAATNLPARSGGCGNLQAGFALQDATLDALSKFDIGALVGPNKCVNTGLGGDVALPENIYAPAQNVGFLCLGNVTASPWRMDVKAGNRVLDMPFVQLPVTTAQGGNLVDMVQAAAFQALGYQQINATGPVAGSNFNLANNTYPNSVTFNYSNHPAGTDITGLTVLDYDGSGSNRLGVAGVAIDKFTDASPLTVRTGGLTGTPAGTRYIGALVAGYYTDQVPRATPIPADRDGAKSATLVRGTVAAPPFVPTASSTLTVNNFLGLSPAVVSGGTTFLFGDAANAGQAPQYSVSTLTIDHTTWMTRLSCEGANPSKVVSSFPQWLVIRPRTATTTTCPGFMSTVAACETFTLPTLPATFPQAMAGTQKQAGFEQKVGSGATCTATCPVAGEMCVVPAGTTLPMQCMGTDGNGRRFTEGYSWTLENRALGNAPTAVAPGSADFTQWKPGLTQVSSNKIDF